jgi:hypothetical protein
MTGLPPGARDGDKGPISGAFLSLIAISLSELRRDLAHLLDTSWDEPLRRRAEELASTLAQACERQGLAEAAAATRSLANLARLPKAKALPLRRALPEKIDALLREAEKGLGKHSKRYIIG